MANVKNKIINGSALVIAVLCIIGMLNLHEVPPLVNYINTHTEGWITAGYYIGGGLLLFFFPLIVGAAIEYPLWESKTRVGLAVANLMHNARNGIAALVAAGVLGGAVMFFSAWGVIVMICG